jgi:hypothetical protein
MYVSPTWKGASWKSSSDKSPRMANVSLIGAGRAKLDSESTQAGFGPLKENATSRASGYSAHDTGLELKHGEPTSLPAGR